MLYPSLAQYFWDIDFKTLDEKKHERYIISRILNYGRLNDWRWLLRTYGSERVSGIIHSKARLGLREPAKRLASIIFE